ncbi:stalk domain-containing protein [Paenibacillus sp. 2TAB23]|uniref:stalk domain-containing protein n=1 Tax=Paenibacillus sp. 2TAB23 TaxID=3233004 RepID=UPI003F9659D5
MKNGKGKIVVVSIVMFLLLLATCVLELRYGMIKKNVYAYNVKNYLKQTYNEPMSIKGVTYLWDNIEPIQARVHPKNEKNLEFSVYPSNESSSGFRDDYVHTLWLHQAKEDMLQHLVHIKQEFKSPLYMDFTCCNTASYDARKNGGSVPYYKLEALTFDVTFQHQRGMEPHDLEQMYQIIKALNQMQQPQFGTVLFLLQPENESYRIEFRIPGANLKSIKTAASLHSYNESRFPARALAEMIDADVSWDESTSSVTITKGVNVLQINQWGEEVLINGKAQTNSLPSFLGDHGNLLVPAAVFEEAFQVPVALIDPFGKQFNK